MFILFVIFAWYQRIQKDIILRFKRGKCVTFKPHWRLNLGPQILDLKKGWEYLLDDPIGPNAIFFQKEGFWVFFIKKVSFPCFKKRETFPF